MKSYKNNFTKKEKFTIKEADFPELSCHSLKKSNEDNEEAYKKAISIIEEKKEKINKSGWIYLEKIGDFKESTNTIKQTFQVESRRKIQQLVDMWDKYKEDYITNYGHDDWISRYGDYQVPDDEEEEMSEEELDQDYNDYEYDF
jgi:hypothetical protein